jgi:hypothetical protein
VETQQQLPPFMTILYRNDHEFPHGRKYNWYNVRQKTHTRRSSKKDFLYDPIYAIIVHNNWIRGKVAKLERFRKSGLWNPSSGLIL